MSPAITRRWPVLLLFPLCGSTCRADGESERETEQRTHRAERLRRFVRQKAAAQQRAARQKDYYERLARATGQTRAAEPPRACEPARELKRRVESAHFAGQYRNAVHLVLAAGRPALVLDGRRVWQRFPLTVRLHPADEPALGRPKARPELELDLRYVPLCRTHNVTVPSQTLRLRLRRRGGRTTLAVHEAGRLPDIPVGRPVSLLLDPTLPTLAGHPGKVGGEPGLWEVTAARFAGRPRTRRLRVATHALPDRVGALHLVEVVTGQSGSEPETSRFITRHEADRFRVVTLGEVLRLAQPITARSQVQQLHRLVLTLKYHRCLGDVRRPGPGASHPCQQVGQAGSPLCQYWRLKHGFASQETIQRLGRSFVVSQLLLCPGQNRRLLQLVLRFTREGGIQLNETDLSPRLGSLEKKLRDLGRQVRRRTR